MVNKKLNVLFAAMFLTACNQTAQEVKSPNTANTAQQSSYSLSVVQAIPKPSEMKANVITNARVSTLVDIDVAYVGKQIPFTYSEGKVANTEGFEWYVSKHFALKTDYPAERAEFFLELLELSYPYYVEYFGMEPPNIDNQRIASTYATSNDKLRMAMFDDGFNRGIHHTAGGEAMYYNWVGYSFPTERHQHQRYISIHETMHSYQMALGNYPWTPSWHGEGLGDSLSNHIFDKDKKQLTVFGHDVPIFDMMSWSLDTYKKEQPTIVEIHDRPRFDRGLNVLFVQFMYSNPEFSQYMKIYSQEVTRRQTASRKESLEILQSVVPDWDKLEADFKAWVAQIDQTHVVATRGPWEIDGNMFYKRKSSYDYAPQRVGFTMKPADKPSYGGLLKLDFPVQDDSDLVLKAKRGVAEPTLAYLLEFKKDEINDGSIGMAFGVKQTEENAKAIEESYRSWKGADTNLDAQYRVEIKEGKTLVLDARTLDGELVEIPLPADITSSIRAQDRAELGVSVQFTKSALVVTVKAKNADTFTHSQAISSTQHEQLVNREFGLVADGNQHGITPYFDDGRDLNPNKPDYSKQTATNYWGFAGDKLAQRFARANWKAGKSTPDSWRKAFDRLNKAPLNPNTADAEIKAIEAMLPALVKDGQGLNEGLAELSGVQLQVDWLGTSLKGLKEYAIITNHGKQPMKGQLTFTVNGSSHKAAVSAAPGEKVTVLIPQDLLDKGKMVTTELAHNWHGTDITQSMEQKTKKYNGYELPSLSAEYVDGKLAISAMLHGPFSGKTKGMVTYDFYHSGKKETVTEELEIKPYQEMALSHSFAVEEKELDHDAWYEVTVVAEVDGEPVTLRKRLPFIPAKFNR